MSPGSRSNAKEVGRLIDGIRCRNAWSSRSARFAAHTSKKVNLRLREEARHRIQEAAKDSAEKINERLESLDREWDIERWLETNASSLALTGSVLGLTVNRKFFAIPLVVLSFLLLHALRGWCPPPCLFSGAAASGPAGKSMKRSMR